MNPATLRGAAVAARALADALAELADEALAKDAAPQALEGEARTFFLNEEHTEKAPKKRARKPKAPVTDEERDKAKRALRASGARGV